jgi:hypothetical protein
MSANDQDDEEQMRTWELLYERIGGLLRKFGVESPVGKGDYWVDDDNPGFRQQKVYLNNLELLKPVVIAALQQLLWERPEWEIMIAVYIPKLGETWPDMGLTIRTHEIIDGLQRQYFPAEFRSIEYEGSRRGTERD